MAMWSCPPQSRWRPPRGLVRLLQRADVARLGDEPPPASLDVLVVLSPLPEPGVELPDVGWSALRAGGSLVDLASVPRRGAGDLVRPWVRARRLREATAIRVRHWLERGAFAPEQWVTVEPADVVVTVVRRAVG